MKVLVTGSASHLARALLPRLLGEARIAQVIGVDLKPAPLVHARYRHVLLDVRAAALADWLAGVEAVVHLAFVVMQSDLGARRRDRAWMRDINVRGSCQVFALSAELGVRTLIHCSSAAVYAPAAVPGTVLCEAHPRGALPGFAYAEDKIAVEDWLDRFEAQHTSPRVVRLRPHLILGPRAQPYLKKLVRLPYYPRLPDPPPRLQCVHEDDVAQAIIAALFTPQARGAYNLAVADALSLREIKRLVCGRAVGVPLVALRALATLAWELFDYGTDPAWVQGLRYDLVLDSSRARRELGWRPRYDSVRDCLAALEAEP